MTEPFAAVVIPEHLEARKPRALGLVDSQVSGYGQDHWRASRFVCECAFRSSDHAFVYLGRCGASGKGEVEPLDETGL